MAAISLPAVVVEDTHPNPIRLPREVRRVLLVRPTSFDYLTRLARDYGSVYSTFLLCDAIDSPTWPYTPSQTRQLQGWPDWHIVGPIYRTPTESEIQDVRARYGADDGREMCVFSMGGGGIHNTDDPDIESFLALSNDVADRLRRDDSNVRLVFVQGPYLPDGVTLPDRFEVVRHEPRMPALLAVADSAVIRAGFNTTWECLASGTPFLPMIGTTVGEPVSDRLAGLERLGLLAGDVDRFCFDREWREGFRRDARAIVDRHPGRPEPRRFQQWIVGPRDDPSAEPILARRHRTLDLRAPERAIRLSRRRGLPFTIRIDDVTCTEPTLAWMLALLASRRLRASLEVVPYLVDFGEDFLDRFDPGGELFEVSQHGYAHVPRTKDGGRRHEFAPDQTSATEQELAAIATGKRRIEEAFPRRFTGGFSPPFDALPPWLPPAWHRQGGAFLSCLFDERLAGLPLPLVRAGIDIWDWARDRAIQHHRIRSKLAAQAASDGHVGIVLHPRCLRHPWERERLVSILNFLQRSGAANTSLRELGTSRPTGAAPGAPGLGRRLRTLISRTVRSPS